MIALLKREIVSSWRSGSGALMGVLFFLTVVTVFPFAVGPDTRLLTQLAPAILWIGALLASLLGLDRLFTQEREDGSLDLLVMQSHPLMLTIFIKASAHWFTTGLPLVLATPLFGIMLNLSPAAVGVTMVTLLAGTPAISFIGTVGAAVAVKLPRGGMLISILVLPLVIPVLIFGIAAIAGASNTSQPFTGPFLFLCAITLFTSVLGPLAASVMLRHSAD
ncbi:MAG: heme exporter protein CcmB [Pseudomonadota bacterium]